jgi:hypothetical protein
MKLGRRFACGLLAVTAACTSPGGGAGSGGSGGRGGGSAAAGASAGATGSAGTNAAAGTNGAAGTSGSGATSGSAGTSGSTGGAGGAGTSGAAGTSAAAGTTGAAGASGAAGSAGTTASAGTVGAAGSAGGAGSNGSGGSAGSAGSTGAAGAPAALAWTWVGVVGTGQSLSVGGHGNVPAEPFGGTTQRFRNLKLSLGNATVPPYDAMNASLTMVPLTEPLRAVTSGYPSPYPRNIYGQGSHTAMADQITTLVQAALGRDAITAHSEVGEAGQPFSVIRKGATDTGTTGRAYAASLFEVAAVARLAKAMGKSYGVGAVVLTHGESDASSATFEADVVKLWNDYNQDLPPLTGQTAAIPLIQSQQHSVPTTAGSRSTATLGQWRSAVSHPGAIVCSGPKYQYPYISDTIHLSNRGYERLGEKTGQVFTERVLLGRDWRPLEPTSVTRVARVITVAFHVPVPPLAWDTTFPAPHQSANTEWAQGRGFEVWAGASRVAISSVAIAGDSVQITCATDPPATGLMIGYAATTDGSARSGGTLRWGQLRDSDPFVGSVTAIAQPNFAVAFEMPVP